MHTTKRMRNPWLYIILVPYDLVSRPNLLFQDHDDALEKMPVDRSVLVVADRCFRLPIRYITAALVKQDLHTRIHDACALRCLLFRLLRRQNRTVPSPRHYL